MLRIIVITAGIWAFGILPGHALGQNPPVIDVHVHSTTTGPEAIALFDSLNVRYVYLSGLMSDQNLGNQWIRGGTCRHWCSRVRAG
jgi:hypothetical protein